MRRKQASIHFSRSALPHRYLRYISWISWVHRPQPSTSWTPTQCRNCARGIFGGAYTLRPQQRRPCLCFHLEDKQTPSDLFSRKRKTSVFPFSRTALACRSSCVALPRSFACRPRPIRGRSITSPSAASPQTKNAGPQHCAANPLTTFVKRAQKSVDFSLKKNTRRHAWLTRSCFGRKNLFIDGPHSLLPFFLSPFLQRKRKKKTEANSAGSNTSLGLTSFVLTMYAIGPRASSAEIYVAIATRFVRDCVEDLAPQAASMERIPRCC